MKKELLIATLTTAALLSACGDDSATNAGNRKNRPTATLSAEEREKLKADYDIDFVAESKEELELIICDKKRGGQKVLLVYEDYSIATCDSGVWFVEENPSDEKDDEKDDEDSSSSEKSSSSAKSSSSSAKEESSDSSDDSLDDESSSSSKDADQSSSSIKVIPVTGLGSCKPVNPTIEKGESVKFVFSPSKETSFSTVDFFKATYEWNFGEDGVVDGSASGPASAPVTYATSGARNDVGLTVTMPSGEQETITCLPLQVNGDPITGCSCHTAEESVDFTVTPDVSWTVSGCTSASGPIAYSWNGDGGDATFTKTFAEATEGYAPVLRVSNSDNTITDIACPAIRVIDGPEYTITSYGSDSRLTFEGNVDVTIVMNLPEGWNPYSEGTVTFACQNYGNGFGPVSGTVDGVPISGAGYFTAYIPYTSTINGYRLKLVLDVGINDGVQCEVRW